MQGKEDTVTEFCTFKCFLLDFYFLDLSSLNMKQASKRLKTKWRYLKKEHLLLLVLSQLLLERGFYILAFWIVS